MPAPDAADVSDNISLTGGTGYHPGPDWGSNAKTEVTKAENACLRTTSSKSKCVRAQLKTEESLMDDLYYP